MLAMDMHIPTDSDHRARGKGHFWTENRDTNFVFAPRSTPRETVLKECGLIYPTSIKAPEAQSCPQDACPNAKTRTLVFFTRVATDNMTENLCIEATWEAKGHFLFLLGKKEQLLCGKKAEESMA